MIQRVLLTGANGFLASHILDQLLAASVHVRAVVWSDAKANQILQDFSAYHDSCHLSIALVPDFTVHGAFDRAVVSTPPFDAIIHTTSSFGDRATSALNHPAVKGALELLSAVKNHAPQIKTVVITSSSAAVIDYELKATNPPSVKVYNEEDWNPVTWEEASVGGASLEYKASKKFVEIAGEYIFEIRCGSPKSNILMPNLTFHSAWDFVKKEKPNFGLVVLYPAAVFGPLKHVVKSVNDLNQSNSMFWKMFCNAGKDFKLPKQTVYSYVDVRVYIFFPHS
jgi:nucleoside-diphosphate-sugar epimerase